MRGPSGRVSVNGRGVSRRRDAARRPAACDVASARLDSIPRGGG